MNCNQQDEKTPDLESWLKSNNLIKLLSVLKDNDINELEDLQELENGNDVEELAKDLKLKVILRKKFKKAVMSLINSNNLTTSPQNIVQQSHSQNMTPQQQPQPGAQKNDNQITGTAFALSYASNNLTGYIQVPKINSIDFTKKNRTMMVIGATGTGKTTLLNSMTNYLYNVQYSDMFRYKLVYEKAKIGGQAISQTDEVSAYHLYPPALGYQLTVIDTPGYGDTRGISQDELITKNIKKYFETEIQQIDVICFVIRAPQARLTPTQKYIFNQVLGIFGNDIKDNIFVLLTFADDKKPPALAALKQGGVPYKKHFKLNNSAFELHDDDDSDDDDDDDSDDDDDDDNNSDDSDDGDHFGTSFWNMGMKSFKKLFKALDKLKPKSLSLTKQVLTRREQLETYIEGIKPTINRGFSILEGMRKQIIFIDKYSDLINANKDFLVETTLNKAKQIPNGGTCTTTCTQCNYTCHKRCGIPDDGRKDGCCAMSGGYCTVCPSKCFWQIHRNLPYTVEWYTVTEKKPVQDLKNKYYDAKDKQTVSEQLIAGLATDLSTIETDLNGLINSVRQCINELSSIALRPNVLNQDDYIDKLIQSEEAERKKGWQQRCQSLNALKQKQKMLSNINSASYNPWAKYNDVQQFLNKKQNTNKNQKKKKGFFSWFS